MPPSFSRRINPVHRIIAAISEHIESEEVAVGVYVTVCIKESADCGIIVSAVEIIKACLVIVVIASVTERVISCRSLGAAVRIQYGNIAPGIVCIHDEASAFIVIYTDNIALDILHKDICPALLTVFIVRHAYRLSRGIIDLYQYVLNTALRPLFTENLCSGKVVRVLDAVYGLARSYADTI